MTGMLSASLGEMSFQENRFASITASVQGARMTVASTPTTGSSTTLLSGNVVGAQATGNMLTSIVGRYGPRLLPLPVHAGRATCRRACRDTGRGEAGACRVSVKLARKRRTAFGLTIEAMSVRWRYSMSVRVILGAMS